MQFLNYGLFKNDDMTDVTDRVMYIEWNVDIARIWEIFYQTVMYQLILKILAGLINFSFSPFLVIKLLKIPEYRPLVETI